MTFWMLVGVGLAGVVVAAATSWFRRNSGSDLGSMSPRWIAEQRLQQRQDYR